MALEGGAAGGVEPDADLDYAVQNLGDASWARRVLARAGDAVYALTCAALTTRASIFEMRRRLGRGSIE